MPNPNLQYRAPAIPTFPDTSVGFLRAAQLLGSAADTGQSILDKYAERQQKDADNALLAELSSFSDGQSLDRAFEGGLLGNHPNASQDAIEIALNRRAYLGNVEGQRLQNRTGAFALGLAQRNDQRSEDQRNFSITNSDLERQARDHAQNVGEGALVTRQRHSEAQILGHVLRAEAGADITEQGHVLSVIANAATARGVSISDMIWTPGFLSALNNITGYAGGEQGQQFDFSQPLSADTQRLIQSFYSGQFQDTTNGATNYFTGPAPDWANETFSRINGSAHLFGSADGPRTSFSGGAFPGQQANPGLTRTGSVVREIETSVNPLADFEQQVQNSNLFTPSEAKEFFPFIPQARQTTDQLIANAQRESDAAIVRDIGRNSEDYAQAVRNLGALNLSPHDALRIQELLAQYFGAFSELYNTELGRRQSGDPSSQLVTERVERALRASEQGRNEEERRAVEESGELPFDWFYNQTGAGDISSLPFVGGFYQVDRAGLLSKWTAFRRDPRYQGITANEQAVIFKRAFRLNPGGFNTLNNVLNDKRLEAEAIPFLSPEERDQHEEISAVVDLETGELSSNETRLAVINSLLTIRGDLSDAYIRLLENEKEQLEARQRELGQGLNATTRELRAQ